MTTNLTQPNDDNKIIGYVGNEPLTDGQLRKEVVEGEKQFEKSEYLTSDQLREEVKKWRNK